jgi:hypothetical protein
MIGGDNATIRNDQPLSDEQPKAAQKFLECALDLLIVLFAHKVSIFNLSADQGNQFSIPYSNRALRHAYGGVPRYGKHRHGTSLG